MNGVNGLNEVLNRITAIENRFGVNQFPVTGVISGSTAVNHSGAANQPFSALLSGTGKKNSTTEAAYQDASSDDVIRMIRLAAQKYGVDPKLAQAVAKAESGYSPDAVSSTGAVGVMQLMPDTAAGLGVRNIQDPRENIDGGVKYLKQMLDTFHGDVTQAVAAYNAGPQAVKDYQGIPPYAETQSYVANVLANYRSF